MATTCASIRRGFSISPDPAVAAAEFYDAVKQPEIGLAMFFCSSNYNLATLGAELRQRFGDVNLIGCTTAGEITPGGYAYGSITGFSIAAADGVAVTESIANVGHCQIAHSHDVVKSLICGLQKSQPAANHTNTVALLVIDGLCSSEELLVSGVHSALGGIPLIGGSAGDDLNMATTHVYHQGKFHSGAALLTLLHLRFPFKVFRSQSLTVSRTRMVVTKADAARRTVSEINAEPAAMEYARLLNRDPCDLNTTTFAEYPLVVKVGGEYHVRSILHTDPDGSLIFACAIDEGLVLTVGRCDDIVRNLETLFAGLRQDIGPPQLVLGFDCVYRYLDLEKRQLLRQAGSVMSANNVIGFCTYGEQFSAMHVNQTFTGIAIGTAHH